MYSVLKSYGLNGLNGFAVAVEADVSGGLPAFWWACRIPPCGKAATVSALP